MKIKTEYVIVVGVGALVLYYFYTQTKDGVAVDSVLGSAGIAAIL